MTSQTAIRKRIAYIVSMPHGIDRWTFNEIEALGEEGIDVFLLPLRYQSGPYMPKANWDYYVFNQRLVLLYQPLWLLKNPLLYLQLLVEALRTHTLIDLFLAFDFVQQINDRKVASIHCVFGDHKLFIGYYCKRILGLPLSVALYGYDLRANPNWQMFCRAINYCDNVVVNCEFNRSLLSDIVGPEIAGRAHVIHHYADLPNNPDERRDKIKVLIVGGFEERKGHDVLFKAVQALGTDRQLVELWAAGYRGHVDVQQLAIEMGIADQVRVFGPVSETMLDFLYEQCDIFCLPSRTDSNGISEGLPVALIEAMAHGKPVISTRLGGIPELVQETLIDENDVQSLATALRRLVHNPRLRRESGLRNLEIIQMRFSKQNLLRMRDLFLQEFWDSAFNTLPKPSKLSGREII